MDDSLDRPGATRDDVARALERSPLGAAFANAPEPTTRALATDLALVWADFEARLARVPIVRAIEDGTVTLADYRRLLLNLRQQVVDGSRWLARLASSLSAELFPLRSAIIVHTEREHRDFQMIERDYCALGGTQDEITRRPKNIGSEALSGWIMNRASQPDPLDLLGAIFVFEGLGVRKASEWASKLKATLALRDDQVMFLGYHGTNDDDHFQTLRRALAAPFVTPALAAQIVRTAKVTARLYALQLEELDNV